MAKDYLGTAVFEHCFWLQVLGDHARFIRDGLPVTEAEEIKTSIYFIRRFDSLLAQARKQITPVDLGELNDRALKYALKFRDYKLHLLRRHLNETFHFTLPPTFVNHMINEIEEYIRVLECLCEGRVPEDMHAVHHHLLWLQDAVGHAASISSELDPTEQDYTMKSKSFQKQFEAYYLKANELAGYLRTNLGDFPALAKFNETVHLKMGLFQAFLNEIEELRLSNEALGALAPLLPDHMAREELYYIMKLAEVSDVDALSGDPTKPRIEN